MTAARLPALLAGLPAVTEEIALSAALPPPAPEDLRATGAMVEKRRIEYLAGRHCARLALARLGVPHHVLRAGADRGPIWPPGIVGSITHTHTGTKTGKMDGGFCGVAVARVADLVALGIDAELDRSLPDELLTTVLTARERDALARRPAEARGRIATLTFSAKESVYKALSPLLGAFIDFPEVDIDIDLDDELAPGAGRFTAEVRAPAVAASAIAPRLAHLDGRLLVAAGVLLTAAVVTP